MKGCKTLPLLFLLSVFLQIGQAQHNDLQLEPGSVLTLLHIRNQPDSEREERLDLLNHTYFPAVQKALPQAFSFHLEGIGGERSGQHVRATLLASGTIRDRYFREEGEKIGMTAEARELWDKATDMLPHEKIRSLFNGWDFSIFNFWRIVSAPGGQADLSKLTGSEMDVHYLKEQPHSDPRQWEKLVAKKLRKLSKKDSRCFLLFSEGGTRKGTYAILELHLPGDSRQQAIRALDLGLETDLFSTYRIW